jgi:hypothetical protein
MLIGEGAQQFDAAIRVSSCTVQRNDQRRFLKALRGIGDIEQGISIGPQIEVMKTGRRIF